MHTAVLWEAAIGERLGETSSSVAFNRSIGIGVRSSKKDPKMSELLMVVSSTEGTTGSIRE